MTHSQQLAQHIRQLYFGGNWTWTNMKDTLSDITWEESIQKVEDFNTIATLTFHIGYFIESVGKVLQGGPLDSKDELSFNHPPINNEEDWQRLLDKTWNDAEVLASELEKFPEEKLFENFVDPKYGNYYRQFLGLLEHSHYHLGQITLIKKMIRVGSSGALQQAQ